MPLDPAYKAGLARHETGQQKSDFYLHLLVLYAITYQNSTKRRFIDARKYYNLS